MLATSIEQSKKLIEAGLKTYTADMVYTNIQEFTGLDQYVLEVRNIIEDFKENEIPAWSLSALFDIVNDCGYYCGEIIELGGNSSIEVIEIAVNFVIDMLTDTGEDEDDDDVIGCIKEWQNNYKN